MSKTVNYKTMNPWHYDMREAHRLLRKARLTKIEKEWLHEVIDDCSHAERKLLRHGLESGPRSLWFDYSKQQWID